MSTSDAAEKIIAVVTSWPGVQSAPGQFDSTAFRVGPREIGHVHRNGIADLSFSHPIRDELISAGRAEPHRYLPNSGWVTFAIRQPSDIESAIRLFRLSYDHAHRTQPPSA